MTTSGVSQTVAAGVVVLLSMVGGAEGQVAEAAGTRWAGVRSGPYAVGFEVRRGLDPTRRINREDGGTHIGMAVWYPARTPSDPRPAPTTLDYRLLTTLSPLPPHERAAYEDSEVAALLGWRHVGIVALTSDQARATLHTHGMALPDAPAADGRFPVVMIVGGQYYLATTAEILASHGFIVVAPFRFVDQSDEIGTGAFSWYQLNSVRDAEWALNEMRAHPYADLRHVSAIGHGGGGMGAMLFAMRNRDVRALVNIDSGNFSNRSRVTEMPFYSSRLLRVPYLFIATAETRRTQDLFDEFHAMSFSDRFEIVMRHPDLRHHDLSDLGRGVTAPLTIRGASQAAVQQGYADVQDMTVRFLLEQSGRRTDTDVRFSEWVATLDAERYTATVRPGTQPAPTTVDVLSTIGVATAGVLREAKRRDPQAPVFQSGDLSRVVSRALVSGDLPAALALADFALEVHPASPVLQELKSAALERRGDRRAAVSVAAACAALTSDNDWRATAAIRECAARVERLGRPVG